MWASPPTMLNLKLSIPSPLGKVILKLLTLITYGDRGQTFRALHLYVIAVGVFALPIPGVPAHICKALFCLPAEDLSALSGICIAGGNVAGATVYDLVGEL